MHATILDAGHPQWSRELEQIGVLLGAGAHPTLFPYHFLFVTLSKIGGKVARFYEGAGAESTVGIGFLFPRRLRESGDAVQRTYTLRFHATSGATPDPQRIVAACEQAMPDDAFVYYDPQGALSYYRTNEPMGAVEIGRPDESEAVASREIQRRVWGAPDNFLYPSDIYSAEFAAGTSLIARVEGKTAGFLFGLRL
ncbi:MAG: hypothetical protein IPM07_10115 [Anaerolineales bacterium]|nr:hypothetical protein [Anaerolineales bacterium]